MQRTWGKTPRPVAERFWEKVDKSGDCWLWTAFRDKHGYGMFITGSRTDGTMKAVRAYRLAYEMEHGPIPLGKGLCVLHRCDNPPCVRPDHLFLGTRRDNVSDMYAKGRMKHGGVVSKKLHPSLPPRSS